METDLDRGMLSFLLAVLMLLWLFLSAITFPGIPACPGILQSATVFPNSCSFAMVCFSYPTFGSVGICFCSSYRPLLESVNIVKFFPFIAVILFSYFIHVLHVFLQ